MRRAARCAAGPSRASSGCSPDNARLHMACSVEITEFVAWMYTLVHPSCARSTWNLQAPDFLSRSRAALVGTVPSCLLAPPLCLRCIRYLPVVPEEARAPTVFLSRVRGSRAARLVHPTVYALRHPLSCMQHVILCHPHTALHLQQPPRSARCRAPQPTRPFTARPLSAATCTTPTHTTVLVLERREAHARYVTLARWGRERQLPRADPREGSGCGAVRGCVRSSEESCEMM